RRRGRPARLLRQARRSAARSVVTPPHTPLISCDWACAAGRRRNALRRPRDVVPATLASTRGDEMQVANELMVKGVVVGVFQENCWVVGSRRTREAFVIDPGDEPETILALAKDMGLNVKRIICSHAHIDHIMAVRPVQERTGADFLLHPADLDIA